MLTQGIVRAYCEGQARMPTRNSVTPTYEAKS